MWRNLSPDDLEREYSPSSRAPAFKEIVAQYQLASDAARRLHGPVVRRYGERPDERVLLMNASGRDNPPLLVYFHGGYWQELSAQASLFPGPACVARGISYAAVDYTLAPSARLGTIVKQCAQAVATVVTAYRKTHPEARVVLCGSSAGAHLAAMMATIDWRAWGCARMLFDGAVLLSGIYDLQPLVPTSINAKLGLDPPEAARLSPQLLELKSPVPALVAWAEHETAEFKRQSQDFAHRMRLAGMSCAELEVPGRNHFDIPFDLCDWATPLGSSTLHLLEGST